MGHYVADRMSQIDMSGIRKMFELASDDAINFGIGEPDFQPPPHVIEAFAQAMRDGHNSYGPTAGIPQLRQAICDRERAKWPEVTPESVVVTAGSTNALYACMVAFVNPGEEVLVPDPGFVLYSPHVRLANGKTVFYPVRQEHGFIPQVEDLEALVSDRTKAIIVNTPSNPLGTAIPPAQIDRIVAFAREHDLLIISDEAYDTITFDAPHASFLGKYENVVYTNTFSKSYAMTGWRLGFVVAPRHLADILKTMNYHLVACPPTPTQHACVAALTGPQDFVDNMRSEFKKRRDLIVKLLREVPGFDIVPPQGSFYAFPSYDLPMEGRELVMHLLKAGVVTTPGEAFGPGGKGHIRFSFATSTENIERGLGIVRDVVADLRK